ncbi:hypothetical protein V2J09_008902 [Rumex salicifolius]
MGYVLRVRLASFFAGAATASLGGIYFLYKDYKLANDSISNQLKRVHESLDQRLSSIEQLKESETPHQVEATE